MADTSDSPAKMDESMLKAAKDRECPYCHQAFTSSSLGRHLDLYIKPHNPKKPDGIHDVNEIRRTRGGVTRRQPKRASGSRQASTSAGTPAGPSQRFDDSEDESLVQSPSMESATQATSAAGFLIGRKSKWPAVNTPAQHGQQQQPGTSTAAPGASGEGARGATSSHAPSRSLNRQALKTQLEMKQKLQDAEDEARGAKLAYREVIHALRSAQHRVDIDSTPFAFDPIAMDFPALTLQCLPAMPTLFSLTQLPTASSWSTLPPGDGQYQSLKNHFRAEYQKFKAKSIAHARVLHAERPRASEATSTDGHEAAELAGQKVDDLERSTLEHLEGAYESWNKLSPERKTELWVLNLARGLATKQADNQQQAAANGRLAQENASLKSQIVQLHRQQNLENPQNPQEPRVFASANMPLSDSLLREIQAASVAPGFDDASVDLEAFVSSALQRCKSAVTANRLSTTGMSAQKPLESSTLSAGPATASADEHGAPSSQARTELASVKFANSTPASLAPTGGVQRQRRGSRAATTRRPVPSGSMSAPTAPAATEAAAMNAPPASPAPAAPVASMEAAQSQQQPTKPIVAKPEPDTDEMEVEQAEADEEDEDEDEEEEEEEDGEADDDDENDDDGDDDTTPPAQQPQQAPTGPGAAGGGAAGGPDADDNDDEDDEMSDKDADAEMEDDGDEFAHMHTPLNMSKPATATGPEQQPAFPYAHNAAHQIPRTAGNTNASLINSGRLISNMGISMPAVSSESMYMD